MRAISTRHITLTTILLALLTCLPARAIDIQCEQLTTVDGLPNNTVRKILQDSHGFIWIATSNGLSRYDGTNFLNFHPSVGASPTLRDQRVHNLREQNGLLRINTSHPDNDWYDLRRGRFVRLASPPSDEPVATPVIGRGGILWNEGDPGRFEDSDGNAWTFLPDGSATFLSRNGHSRHFELTGQKTSNRHEQRCVMRDSRGWYWLTTSTNGLFIYNAKSDSVVHYTNSTHPEILPSDRLKYVMEDRSGSVWIGTDNAGITHARIISNSGVSYTLPNCEIRLLAQTSDSAIVVGDKRGMLYYYDSAFTTLARTETYAANVYCTLTDRQGTTWIGTKGDGLTIGTQQYHRQTGNPKALHSNDIYALLPDRYGNVWIGTLGGGISLAHREKDGRYTFTTFLDQHYNLSRIRSLAEDDNGNVWAATSHGVVVFDPKATARLRRLVPLAWLNTDNVLKSNEIRSIMRSQNGDIYISETGVGFCICKSPQRGRYKQLSIRHFDTHDGLVNPMVQSFASDSKGRIWIATEYGMSRFTPDDGSIQSYFFAHSMLANVYSEASGISTKSGMMLFGTNSGLLALSPEDFADEKRELNVHLTAVRHNGLSINGIGFTKDGDSTDVAYAEEIHLAHDQNSFSIDFSTFDYAITSATYSYWLEGYEKEWSEGSNTNSAAYKNLSPGSYVLHIRVRNPSGHWSQPTSVGITIAYPPLLSPLAIFCYLAAIAIASLVVWRIVRSNKRLHHTVQDLKEQKDRIRERFSTEVRIKRKNKVDADTEAFVSMVESIATRELGNAAFTTDDFAAATGLGRTIFYNRMKEATGYTPKDYLRRRRMKRAAELISTSTYTIAEISLMVGIDDPAYFSRCFKAQYGVPPSAWKTESAARGTNDSDRPSSRGAVAENQ